MNKWNYLAFIGLWLWTHALYSQAPGDVSANLELWLKVDAGVTNSGSSVSAWADQSGNGNDATAGDNPTIVNNVLNGNPVIEFDGANDDIGGSAGFYTHDYFLVLDPIQSYDSGDGDDAPLGLNSEDNSGVKFGSFTGLLTDEVLTHTINTGDYRAGVTGASIIFEDPMLVNFRNNAGATDQELYLDGALTAITTANPFSNLSNVTYTIGSNGAGGDPYDGRVAEVISYSVRLTDSERRDIATYLAIKYGIALDMTSQNYTVGGSAIYDNAGYINDVAGIAQDDSQGLVQTSSKSVNADAMVEINNASTLGDGDYLVWGNDDGARTLTTSNIPGGVTHRLNRIWRVDVTGTPGTVDVTFDVTNLPVNYSASTFNLLVAPSGASMPGGLPSTTPSAAGSISTADGLTFVTFSGITLTDDEFFTLAGTLVIEAPGDVSSNLSLWLKADNGVNTSGTAVTGWFDKSGNANNSAQSDSGEQPILVSEALNGHPVVEFDGANDEMLATGGFYTHDYFLVLDPIQSYDSGDGDDSPLGINGESNSGVKFGAFTGNLADEVLTHAIEGNDYQAGVTSAVITYEDPMLVNFRNNAGATDQELYLDGLLTGVTIANTFTNYSDVSYTLGSSGTGGDAYDGRIVEVISYSARLTDSERRDVATYLAIKYGLTLDMTSQNYTVGGVAIYDNAGYTNDIAGIGQDDSQGLDQTGSTNFSGGTVTMNNASSQDDGDFLVWGHDGGITTLTISDTPGSVDERLTRIWRVDETNDVGTIDISFNLNVLGLSGGLDYDLLVAGSGATMPIDLSGVTPIAGTVTDGIVTFSGVTINDDEYFTLGVSTPANPIAPGNVLTDLKVWLKADKGVTHSSNVVSGWTDQSNNGNSAVQGITAERPTLVSNALNGNNAIDFDGGDDNLDGESGFYTHDYFIVTRPNQIFDDASGDDAILGLNSEDFSGLFIGGSHTTILADEILTHSLTSDDYRSGLISTTITLSEPLLINFRNNAGGTEQELYLDGASTAVTTANTFSNLSNVAFTIGANGEDGDDYDGLIAEVISYSSRLADSERRDVATYLAVKYGLTLDITTQDYTIGGSSIFTHNSYSSDIAGIGRDDSQELLQSGSQSSNSGSLVAMSNAGSLGDGDFLIWGNDAGSLAITTSNVPGGATERLTRIWRIDQTGSVGTVEVVFDISELPVNLGSSTFNLLVAGSGEIMPTGLTNATVSAVGTVNTSNGRTTVTFDNILFSDDEYFTLGGAIVTEAPGDITTGLEVWLKANDGVVQNGSNVTEWLDQSGNNNSTSTDDSDDEPLFLSDALNGNPGIEFDGGNDDLYGTQGFYTHDYFIVVDPITVYSSTTAGGYILGLNDIDFSGTVIGEFTGQLTDEVLTYAEDASLYRSGVTGTTVTYEDPFIINFRNNATPDDQELYLDGLLTGTTTANAFTNLNDVSFRIGQSGEENDSFNGIITEIISYSARLSDADRRDVSSYLAIKYGITLDITTQDYTVGGSSIYTHNAYPNDIAGIGQNDSQGLNQTSSKSINSGSLVSMSNASDLADGEYLVWGNDGGATTSTTNNTPVSVTDRLERIWRVDETGDVGTTDVVFDITSLALNPTASTFNMLIAASGSTMPIDLAGTTPTAAGIVSTSGGRTIVTFSGIDFGDDEFFTLAGDFVSEAPGDISANLELWLKADSGPVESGGTINTWIDKSGNANDAVQAETAEQPTLLSDGLNGNAAVNFDGVADDMRGSAGFYTHDYFVVLDLNEVIVSTSGDDYAITFNDEEFSGLVFGGFTAQLTDEVMTHALSTNNYRSGITGTTQSFSAPLIINFRNNAGTTDQELYLDGLLTATTTANGHANFTDVSYILGARDGDNDHWTGAISEVISYSARLADADRRDVSSYLSLKYGLTLDITTQNYTIGGAAIYDNTSYPDNIAGIGRDDSQGLNQTSSRSENAGNSVRITNASSLDDGDFLIWGNDGTAVDVTIANIPGGVTNRLTRIWRVDETNDVGTVDVIFDLSALGLATDGTYNLLIAASGATMPTDLSAASVSAAGTVSTVDGRTVVTFSGITLNDDEYFTLAGDLTKPAPGDVATGLSVWLKANAGVVQSGSSVTDWLDQSGNGNDANQIESSLQPNYNSSALNSNPGITFDGSNDILTGSAGFYTHEYFVVVDPSELYNSVNAVGRIIGYEPDNFSSFALGPSTDAITDEIITHATQSSGESGYRSLQVSTTSTFGNPTVLNSHNNGGATGQEIRRDGNRIDNTELNTGNFLNFSDNPYNLGESFGAAVAAPFNGTMAEVISFSSALTNSQRRDVATYLALKYGITLDISGADPFDAYTVGGTEIYNYATYINDIAGIAKDDSQCLNQTSSQSVNDGSIVQLSSASDLDDAEFMIWGNDGGSNGFTTSNVPAGAIERLIRIWRLDETGDVGTVTVSFDLTSLGIDVSNSTLNLIVSPTTATMPTDLATAALISGGTVSTVNGREILTFTGVDFADGDYFTLAGDAQSTAPGGVSANLALWLRGSDGVTESSSLVSNWSDKSGNGNDAFQGTSSEKPTVVSGGINFNDVLEFNSDNLDGVSGFYSHDYFAVLSSDVKIDRNAGYGFPLSFTNRDANGLALGAETGLLTNEVVSHITSDITASTYASGQTGSTVAYSAGIPILVNFKNNSAATGQQLYVDGALKTTTQANTNNFINYSDDVYRVGNNIAETGAFDGQIAEIISYSARLSDTDRRDVESYLALRYGITLDISSQNYTEGGVAIYDNTSYANDIAGLGKNLDNAINQTSSKSSNNGSIVTMSGLSDLDNGEYLIWGNDGTDKTATQSSEIPTGIEQRLTTEWQVDVTGTPGTTRVSFDISDIDGIGALPTTAGSYTLLIDDDNDFSADLISQVSGSSLSGDILSFTGVSFSNNHYFTLALPTPPAPGDVNNNLTLWLKADKGITESSNAVSDWTDQSGNNNDAAQGTSASRPTFTANSLNGNPVIDFDGTDDVLEGISGAGFNTQDYFVVFRPDNTINSSSPVETVLGYNSGAANGLYLGGDVESLILNEVITHVVGSYERAENTPAVSYSTYQIFNSRNNAAATSQEIYADEVRIDDTENGAFANHTDTDYTIGDQFTTGRPLDGKIAEVISYSTRLTDAQRRDVATYLALKYGITIDISGANPFDAYTVESAEIYNQTSYDNDIAGIGSNGSQELSQTSSTSINSDAIVTVSNPSALSDGDYLVWGNDDGLTSTTILGVPAGVTERMTRVWGITETGNAGDVTIAMDLTGLVGYGGKVVTDFQLIIDDNNDFTDGVLELVPAQTFASNVVTFINVDFTGATNFGLGSASDFITDSDGDGIPDYFEVAKGTDENDVNSPITDGNLDDNLDATPNQGMNDTGINGDGISDGLERILVDNGATAPISRITDTDGDGIPDYREVRNGTDPFDSDQPTDGGAVDSDSDGLPDALEVLITSEGGAADPALNTDTDGDGIPDYYEVLNNNDPNDVNDPTANGGNDADADGISDGMEQILVDGGASAPIEVSTDTDSDGIPDYIEALTNSDPFNDADPFAVGIPDVRALQADYLVTGGSCVAISGYQWIDVFDNLGNIVFSINPVGNNLGSTCWGVRIVNSTDDDVRDNGFDYVLDRNWYITPTVQPSSDVFIRFYALAEEHTDLGDELLSAESFTFDEEAHLRITKISGVANSLDPFITGGTRININPEVQDYASNGKSLTIGISSFSSFAPHVTPAALNAPLPIELIVFEAKVSGDDVVLKWSTATEVNNDFFTIERSFNAENFEVLGQVEGAGNSKQRKDYTFLDSSPVRGVNYYRLKQTNYDGDFSYSEAVAVIFEGATQLIIKAYPNPVSNNLTVAISSGFNPGNLAMRLTDLSGQQVGKWTFENVSSQVQLPLSNIRKGLYILELEIGNRLYKHKILKD